MSNPTNVKEYLEKNSPNLLYCIEKTCLSFALSKKNIKAYVIPNDSELTSLKKEVDKNETDVHSKVKQLFLKKYEINGKNLNLKETLSDTEEKSLKYKEMKTVNLCGKGDSGSVKIFHLEDKYFGGKKGGYYTGGSDTDFSTYNIPRQVNTNWTGHVEYIKSAAMGYCKFPIKSIDPATLSLLSMRHYMREKSKNDADKVLLDNLPCSPLSALFLGEYLCRKKLIEDWASKNREYINSDELKEIKKDFKSKKTDVTLPQLVQVKEYSKIHEGVIEVVKQKLHIKDDELAYFILGAQEFCYYFTVPYINALSSKDADAIAKIFDYYTNYIMGCKSQNRLLFLRPNNITTGKDVDKRCSILSFLMNDSFLTTGLNTEEGNNNYTFGWGSTIQPNNTTMYTSFHAILNNFWTDTVKPK